MRIFFSRRKQKRFRLKPSAHEPVYIISAVEPNVILLAEKLFAFLRHGDGIIFQRFFEYGRKGNLKNCEPPWLQNSMQLPHGLHVVLHMFEDMVADDKIK